ncbi:MAG: hypothetical protein WKF84_20865 [Pyrinomonadaceae bacterium]
MRDSKRRSNLLKNVTKISNPRFGVDRSLGVIADLLGRFYGADRCFIITKEDGREAYFLQQANQHTPSLQSPRLDAVPPEVGRQLLALPPTDAIVYNHRSFINQCKSITFDVKHLLEVKTQQVEVQEHR